MPGFAHEAFPAAHARRLVERFELRYAPKHGSWLDLAESELGDLPPNVSSSASPLSKPWSIMVAAWTRKRNAVTAGPDWRFTTSDARIKLRSLLSFSESRH